MNIKDTFSALESKLSEVDSLMDAYTDAKQDGESFKAHGISKSIDKVTGEIMKLTQDMDCSDIDDFLEAEEEIVVDNTTDFLTAQSNMLQTLLIEYVEANKEKNTILSRRLLKDIQKIGNEIAHVTDIIPKTIIDIIKGKT